MKKNQNEVGSNPKCKEIEPLMYLKDDELSVEEVDLLESHLKRCQPCMTKHLEIQDALIRTRFEPSGEPSKYFIDQIKHQIDHSFNITPHKSVKQSSYLSIQKLLAAACIIFFISFSLEQISTLSKISKLEKRIQNESPISYQDKHKGELLIINNFISLDDIISLASSKFRSHIPGTPSISEFNKSSWSHWYLKLSPNEKKSFVNDLMNKVTIQIPMITSGKIERIVAGSYNERALNK